MKILILDNIISSLNVGSIFRTASGIGIDKIFLCGITPTPFESGKKYAGKNILRKDFIKTSLGAEEEIFWEHKENILEVLENLKKENYKIIALEQNSKSLDYKNSKIEKYINENLKGNKNFLQEINLAILIGSERDGILKDRLDLAEEILEIPMLGLKESLNVTIATAILLYRLLDKNNF